MICTVCMLFMSLSMSYAGLIGSPRRTEYTTYGGHPTALEWDPYLIFLGAGGTLLFAGVVLIVYIVFHLMFLAPKGYTEFMMVEEKGGDEKKTPKWTGKMGMWGVVTILYISMGYVIP